MLDWVPHGQTGYSMAMTGEHISSSCWSCCIAVEYNMQSGIRTNWKIYRKDILNYFLEGLKRQNKDKIIIFILAPWYVHTQHANRLEFYMDNF